MKVIPFSLYSLINSIHLYSLYVENTPLKRYSKPLLIPSLMLFYYLSSSKVSKTLFTALFFAFLGDTFLMYQKTFILGCFTFCLGNTLYAYLNYKKINKINFPLLITSLSIFYSIYLFGMFPYVKSYLGEMIYLVFLYFIPLVFMNSFAFYNMCNNRDTKSILLFIGTLCFMISDYILTIVWYVKPNYPMYLINEYVMVTYLSAQGLLTYGLA